MQETGKLYAFEITLHRLARGAEEEPRPTEVHVDASGSWPTLAVDRAVLNSPMAVGFDEALARLGRLERTYAEPDGSFVQASPTGGEAWQVDGNAAEMNGRILTVDLKGQCPPAAFDRLLECFGWPEEPLMVQLVRAGVFLDEETFRRHALARGTAGAVRIVRPE